MPLANLTIQHADAASLLAIYLQDHLAGATAGASLAARTHANNRSTRFEAPLGELRRQIEEDLRTLQRIMRHLGVAPSRPKQALAFVGERAARVKPNGQLLGYSPLSRLIEFDALAAGISGKIGLWRSLSAALDPSRLPPDVDLHELIARGEAQRERIEELRVPAARHAFPPA